MSSSLFYTLPFRIIFLAKKKKRKLLLFLPSFIVQLSSGFNTFLFFPSLPVLYEKAKHFFWIFPEMGAQGWIKYNEIWIIMRMEEELNYFYWILPYKKLHIFCGIQEDCFCVWLKLWNQYKSSKLFLILKVLLLLVVVLSISPQIDKPTRSIKYLIDPLINRMGKVEIP